MNECPQNVQELVHEYAEGLHLGEGIAGPVLQMRIKFGEVEIVLDQTQAGEIGQGSQTSATLAGHGSAAALFLTGGIGGRLDSCELDPLCSSLIASGITDFCQEQGGRNFSQNGSQIGSLREVAQVIGQSVCQVFQLLLKGMQIVQVRLDCQLNSRNSFGNPDGGGAQLVGSSQFHRQQLFAGEGSANLCNERIHRHLANDNSRGAGSQECLTSLTFQILESLE